MKVEKLYSMAYHYPPQIPSGTEKFLTVVAAVAASIGVRSDPATRLLSTTNIYGHATANDATGSRRSADWNGVGLNVWNTTPVPTRIILNDPTMVTIVIWSLWQFADVSFGRPDDLTILQLAQA